MSGAAAPQAPHAIHVSLSTIVYLAINFFSPFCVNTKVLPSYSKAVFHTFQPYPTKTGEFALIFQQILLQIFHKLNKERTISAAYHLLRGKRSGQTIQDVGIFKLHSFFGILPKLSRKTFDAEITKLTSEEYLQIQENGYYVLTEKAIEKAQITPPFRFDGWHYRGNEHIFFSRLTLIVQSLSHQKAGQMSFSPVIKDESVQKWVRSFLKWSQYQSGEVQQKLFHEMSDTLQQSSLTEKSRALIVYRLSGEGVPGWTWQQIAHDYQLEQMDVQLQFIEGLHIWLTVIEASRETSLLKKVSEGIRVEDVLTGSANQTAQLFQQGYSIEQISSIRRLKMSTIEDHIVELAMNEPNFPIKQFVSKEDILLVKQQITSLQTKKLRVLHEVAEHLSYFQLRIILAKGDD